MMVYNELELVQKSTIKFSQHGSNSTNVDSDISFGEIIHDGKLSWLATGAHLEVFSLKDGQRVCSYHFDSHERFGKTIITTVTEIECANENCCFLAVGLQISDAVESIIAIYSVQGSKILRCIEIPERITCCAHISGDITKRTFLQLMQGCLAIGTDIGKLILLDINFKKCEAALLEEIGDILDSVPCHMVKSTLDFTHISNHYKHTLQENFNFGIELEQVRGESFVLSLLPVAPALCLIAGLEDGRMIIYDLTELQILYIVLPQEHHSPLSKMTFLQPQDDPRAMVYIWAFHENPESCFAVMHCLEYEKKIVDENDQIVLFEEFQTSHVKLVLTMNEKNSLPIRCQAIAKFSNKEDDSDAISICMLAWKTKKFTQLLIFDMNQWYKEEMPEGGDWREHLTYLSPFRVKNLFTYDVYFDRNTVSHFNSVQRIEEHFYPISLTFDFVFLLSNANVGFHWPGLQYRALDVLKIAGPLAILEPGPYYNEMKCASLLPQLFDAEKKKTEVSLCTQREILLSVALEYNCIGLLKNCARSWADGSCIGQRPNEGVSLSTLTDWIWKRAGFLKQRCNDICVCLFDYSGRLMDQRSKKELFHFTRQLKILADILEIVLTNCKLQIPNHVFEGLHTELNSIRTASEFQEVLQWLLNIGLLPEGLSESSLDCEQSSNPFLVPYPYKLLNNYYKVQRLRFLEIDHALIKPRTNGCRLLYIDSFIERKCNIEALKEHWQIEHGKAAYPPPTMQALLRTLLVPDVPLETKHALLIYAFLDLNMAVAEENYAGVVQNLIKFPAVFKLNASLIKTVQAFWNLDHGQFEVALEEIICPFLHEKKLEQWEQELLIESLLVQEKPSLALRALQARSAPVNSTLELKVYVANNLISEAFHLARSKNDPELLQTFVKCCEYVGKWNVLRDLALTEEEEKVVEDLLKDFKNSKPENIYLMYMLQKSKYIEAKTFLDEMRSSNNNSIRHCNNNLVTSGGDLELSKTLLSAYNSTMTPFSKNLNECYYYMRNKVGFSNQLKNKSNNKLLKPFSAELLKENKKSLNDGLFQSSILSVDGASNYWNEKSASRDREERMMQTNNVPFVRKPQLEAYVEIISSTDLLAYPEAFKEPKKRRLDSEEYSIDSNGITHEDAIQESRKKRIRLIDLDSFGVFGENERSKTIYEKHNKNEPTSTPVLSRNLLNTPMVESCKFAAKVRSKFETDKTLTPQSILKIKSLIKPNSASILRPVKISNAKPIEHEYTESDNASEVIEVENEIYENVHYSDSLQEISNVDDTLGIVRTEISNSQTKNSNDKKNSNIDSEKSEIDTGTTIQEKHTEPTSFEPYYSPKSRKTIRTSNMNILIPSSSEVFSSITSADRTKFFSPQNTVSHINIKDVSILDNQISIDSGAIINTSDSSLSSFIKTERAQIKSLGPTPRRPLRRSETPPKRNEEIKSLSKRVVHSEEMSDSDMLSRKNYSENAQKDTEYKSYTIFTPPLRPPLSRLVAEKNLVKNISLSSKEGNTDYKANTESVRFKEITEYSSELYKTSTNEFNPLTCSSKVTHTVSKFIENANKVKVSDQTTIVGDVSATDVTEIKSSSENSFHSPKDNQQIPTESLMTTVEATSTSWIDGTKAISKQSEFYDYGMKINKIDEQKQAQHKNPQKGIKICEVMESEDEEMEKNHDLWEKEKAEEEEELSNSHQSKFENFNKSQCENVIDISSGTSVVSSSSQSETSSSSSNSSQETSKESSKSSTNKSVETPNKELISYDLMEKILRNATAKNLRKLEIMERKFNEVVTEKIGDRKISGSSSLDSTLEISNEEVVDFSKDDQINDDTTIQKGGEVSKKQTLGIVEAKFEEALQNHQIEVGEHLKSSKNKAILRKIVQTFFEYNSSAGEDNSSIEEDNPSVDENLNESCNTPIIYKAPVKSSEKQQPSEDNLKKLNVDKNIKTVGVELEDILQHNQTKFDHVCNAFENSNETHLQPVDPQQSCEKHNVEKNVKMVEVKIEEEILKGNQKESNKDEKTPINVKMAEEKVDEILKSKQKECNKHKETPIQDLDETSSKSLIRKTRAKSVDSKISQDDDVSHFLRKSTRANSEQKDFYKNDIINNSSEKNSITSKSKTHSYTPHQIFSQNNSHWLRSSKSNSMQPEPNKHEVIVHYSSKQISNKVTDKIRAQSVEPETFERNYSIHSPRPKRATSELPNVDSITKLKKIDKKHSSPSTIMTRRRSRLLDRIEEENVLESPTTNTLLRKRNDSSATGSSFTLNVECEESFASPGTQARRNSRGVSSEKTFVTTDDSNSENIETPTRRLSRRLSIHKETDVTTDNKEFFNTPIKKARRHSISIENSEMLSTPLGTRTSTSLREFVLTPRRNFRAASLSKELSTSLQEELESAGKFAVKKTSRRLSQNESTPKQLFQGDEPENNSNIVSLGMEDIEADTSTEKDENETEDYSMQRRLTRTQKNLMEKSANIKAIDQRMIPLKKRQSRIEMDESLETPSPSKSDDAVSVKSNKSKKSTTSARHSSRLSKTKDDELDNDDDNDDLESTISSLRSTTSNNSPNKRRLGRSRLRIISEKDEDNNKHSSDIESNSTSNSGPKLRTRIKKAN